MVVIDTHCHASDVWYEPVETLLFEMDRNGVDGAILIQILGQTDNSYQEECLQRYPGRFASVVGVDPLQPEAPQQLRRLAEGGAVGVRLRPGSRSPGADPLAIWRTAAELGLVVSCPTPSAEFVSDVSELASALPDLKLVIEHLGGSSRSNDDEAERAARLQVFGLARYPNVFMKVPGLGEFARRAMPVKSPFPFEEPIPAYLEQAYGAFGPARLMWGSDFPPVASREGYAHALRMSREQFAAHGSDASNRIFGGTAAEVFGIG
jgi:L-fuconolactonase